MKKWVKRILLGVLGVVLVLALGGFTFVSVETSAFDKSMDRVYDIPTPTVAISKDPAVIERGRHLTHSVMPCAIAECHGSDFSGGKTIAMGPLGSLTGPNITPAGLGAAYSDGEIARMLRHGIKKDGRSLRFMPAQDSNWLPDADLAAIVSYLRTQGPVEKPNGTLVIGTLGKILDQRGQVLLDVARHIDHDHIEMAPPPAPTAEYGRFIARLCMGCHGEHLSGGPIPGAPASLPTPLNLTPHATGLAGWSYDDFAKLIDAGTRKNGKPLNPFMPREALQNYDDTERHALWAYLQTLPPTPLGNR
jgi:mono/diheme cytochrome c family protein